MPNSSDEFERIRRYFAPLARDFPGAYGLTDDAALVDGLVVTVDALVAGVHFVGDEPPGLIARKALRVNLSDLAAKGARPEAYLLTTILPYGTGDDWVAGFTAGLAADQAEFDIRLAGGDTVATPGPLAISITALGRAAASGPILRSGASPGDGIWVSGTLGDAALGLEVARGDRLGLAPEEAAWLLDRYRLPRPRVALGPRLAGVASAAMDVSDGLLQDLGHIAAASAVRALVTVEDLPLSLAGRRALERRPALLDRVLGGGDDYELLFTVPANREFLLYNMVQGSSIELTRIGVVTDGAGVEARDRSGARVEPGAPGWRHF